MLDAIVRISVELRLEKAHQCLQAAETLLSVGTFADSANRSYYAIFPILLPPEIFPKFVTRNFTHPKFYSCFLAVHTV